MALVALGVFVLFLLVNLGALVWLDGAALAGRFGRPMQIVAGLVTATVAACVGAAVLSRRGKTAGQGSGTRRNGESGPAAQDGSSREAPRAGIGLGAEQGQGRWPVAPEVTQIGFECFRAAAE